MTAKPNWIQDRLPGGRLARFPSVRVEGGRVVDTKPEQPKGAERKRAA